MRTATCVINLEAIGKTAISVHNASQKHKKCAQMIDSNHSMKNFSRAHLNQWTQIIRQQLLRVLGHITLSNTSNHFFPITARPNCLKQFFQIQALLRSLLLPEQRQRASLPGYLLPMLKRSCYLTLVFSPSQSQSMPPITTKWNSTGYQVLQCQSWSYCASFRSASDARWDLGRDHEIYSFEREREWTGSATVDIVCADNAAVNFGGCNQGGKNNVFYHFTERKTCLIPIGCPAHVLHNVAEKGAERLKVDIETIVLKIGSHFKSQTGRENSLK